MAIPNHVAIIADGNRRWAAARGMPKLLGHTEGAKNLERIAKAAIKHGIKYLTIYALSTENLKGRSHEELRHLFNIFAKIAEHEQLFHENKARFRVIGDTSKLPMSLQQKLRGLEERTKEHSRIMLTVALNYGGRDEIIRAASRALEKDKRGKTIDEAAFSSLLDTAGLPDVDLVIRTGGHRRLSNFLLWQAAYAELYFTDTFWPAFGEKEFAAALAWFAEQQRNRGE
jgi:undecaprenyl diphosphate synthase